MQTLGPLVRAPGGRSFLLIWLGQLVSLTGTALTQFALGVWVYQRTGSATGFAATVFCAALPQVLLAPLAGPLVDRLDRRRVLIASDLGAGLVTVALMLLLAGGRLELWHIYAATALSAACSAFQGPAYAASVTMLLPSEHYARASGMGALAPSVAAIVAPALAGLLIVTAGLPAVLLADAATFLFAVATLALSRLPSPPRPEAGAAPTTLLQDAAEAWRYLRAHPGLLGLLGMAALGNFLGITSEVLLAPYVLAFASPEVLGGIVALGGAGFFAGGLLLTAWGGPRGLVRGIFGFELLVCAASLVIGLTRDPALLGGASFVYFAAIALGDGCAVALWRRKVPPGLQGRVFALRNALAVAALPLGLLIWAPLAEFVFEPLLQPGGAWFRALGALLDGGPGGGIALVFVLAALFNLGVLLAGWLAPRIRRIEAEVPEGRDPEG